MLFHPDRTMIRDIEKRTQEERGGSNDSDFISRSDVFGRSHQRADERGRESGMVWRFMAAEGRLRSDRGRLAYLLSDAEAADEATGGVVLRAAVTARSDE